MIVSWSQRTQLNHRGNNKKRFHNYPFERVLSLPLKSNKWNREPVDSETLTMLEVIHLHDQHDSPTKILITNPIIGLGRFKFDFEGK